MAPSLRRIARGAGVLAGLTGTAGFLSLMGAAGPISCVSSSSSGGDGGAVNRNCVAGIDYLFGSTGGNAPVLFFWAMVLLGLVTLGVGATWTGQRHLTWVAATAGVVVSIIGLMSIGFYFVLPTLFLLVAATALTVEARRDTNGRTTDETRS